MRCTTGEILLLKHEGMEEWRIGKRNTLYCVFEIGTTCEVVEYKMSGKEHTLPLKNKTKLEIINTPFIY